nr:sigma-54 factor interaction domain-containing protein [Kofleriaceae bacterium]
MARTRDAGEDDRALAAGALDDLVGAVLVLDHQLRIRLATATAGVVLGFTPPIGASAATLLCGDRPKKPFAEALAEGRPFQAIIPRPGPASGSAAPAMVRARSVPIGGDGERGDDDRPPGWLVYLAAVTAGDDEPVEFHGMWTRDPRMKEAFRIIGKVAGEDAPVLIRGETGTGKELVAHALHAASSRRAGPFRAINCAALPGNLLESELFGHARGAFTGAVKDTPGHILLADGGTLFLDEIAEMPLELQ